MTLERNSGYALSVSGGVAAGPCSVMGELRRLCLDTNYEEPMFVRNAFSRMKAEQELQFVAIPQGYWPTIDLLGGSILGNSKPGEMPSSAKDFEIIARAISKTGIRKLINIGGDDTGRVTAGILDHGHNFQAVHIPKTVDNDVNIPHGYTLGSQTCAHYGAKNVNGRLVNSSMLDRTYYSICMGRHSGILPYMTYKKAQELAEEAVGREKPRLLLTSEFFHYNVAFSTLAAIAVGSRLKLELNSESSLSFAHGVIFGENLVDVLQAGELKGVRREDGNLVIAEAGLDKKLQKAISRLLERLGKPEYAKVTQMGVAPRGMPPIQEDIDLAHALTQNAFELLEKGETKRTVFINAQGNFESIPFSELRDENGDGISKKLSEDQVAEIKKEMTVLRPEDLQSPNVERLAKHANISVDDFRRTFGPAVEALFVNNE